MDDFDRQFARQSARVQKLLIISIIAKLLMVGGLIWLAVYAINAFTG